MMASLCFLISLVSSVIDGQSDFIFVKKKTV
jgi:hypothetical protein